MKEKVRKIIKKATKFLVWTTGIFVVLLVVAYFAFRSPAVQTWVCQKLGNYLADELKTKITIQGVDIKFFTSVELEGLYVEDQHHDTLLLAPSFTVDLSLFNFSKQHVNVDAITLTNANIVLKKYEGDTGLNYRFIMKYFQGSDTSTTDDGSAWDVKLGKIALENCTFSYIDTRYNDVDRGMDYENILVSDIFVTLERIEPMGDSTSIYLSELKAKEQCGLDVQHMETRLMVADTFIKMNDLVIQTPGSDIKGWLGFHYNSFDDIEDDFIHKVTMTGHFSESVIEMGDIAYFSPVLLGIQKKVLLTGDVNGTVEKLKTRNIDLRFGEKSRIAGNFSFDGLPDIETTDMHLKFKESTTNFKDLSDIPIAPFNDSSFLTVSSRIALLGDMSFTGTMEGFIDDFVAHGKLRTAQGNLVLQNLAMTKDSTADDYNWEGILTAEEFNIGSFLGVADMGHISGTANMIGYGTDVASIVASMNANFSSFEYFGYRYHNITVTEGQLAKEVFDGVVDVRDPNVSLHYDGFVDFKDEKDPIMDFRARIDTANLSNLGFVDTSMHLIVSADLRFDMHGNSIDNLDGFMRFSNINYSKNDHDYFLDGLVLNSYRDPAGRHLVFNSDFLTANMDGEFAIMKLPEAITDVMTAYVPAFFPPRVVDPKSKAVPQRFTWSATFGRNTDAIASFLPDVRVAPNTYLQGSFDQAQRNFKFDATSDSLAFGAYEIKKVNYVSAQGTGGRATLNSNIARVQVNDSTGFDNILLTADAGSNVLELSELSWNNNTKVQNTGILKATTTFESEKSLRVKINEGNFSFNDSTWIVDPNNLIRKDSSRITFTDLVFRSGSQVISMQGVVSNNPADVLNVKLDRFNLTSLNFFTQANDLTLGGYVSGTTSLSNLYNEPKFDGNATFDEFWLNNNRLGDGEAIASYKPDRQGIFITTSFWRGLDVNKDPIKNITLNGWYFPKAKDNSLDLTATLYQVPLGLIQPVLKDYCSVIVGMIDGSVDVEGTFGHPLLKGDLDVWIRKVKVDYLGIELVQWQHTQKIEIQNNAIVFDNFTVSDNQGDTAVINGSLFHDNFKKFQFDMYFEFDHFMVLNTTEKDNEDYYGRVWATGYMDLFGYADSKITMNITATTVGKMVGGNFVSSDFNIPMSSTSETGENDFIQFEAFGANDTVNHTEDQGKQVFNDNGMDLKLNLTVTDEALVHVIFDETVGDELSARGEGDLEMHIMPSGEFTMVGSYLAHSGDYMFTLKNIVYAPFELVDGGLLSWNGDPADARIDADAVYRANASVEPFFPFDSTTAAYQQAYPVDVIMHLDGQLVNPALSFDIELPTADPGIQETVKSYTQTELEMNRQVLSLMVLNSFMTPSEFRDGTEGGAAGGAGTTLLSNFVSGTLNNWLSQISENANVKFKYRPNDDMSLQELKLALGTQLLNNRLTIDVAGSLTNANQTQTQGGYNQYVDANVEYKVTEDGKVRLRAFNRGNENSGLTQSANYTQGAGVFYREDFETFHELFQRYRNNLKMSKEKSKETQGEESRKQDSLPQSPPKVDSVKPNTMPN
jgi:hypothetical protein